MDLFKLLDLLLAGGLLCGGGLLLSLFLAFIYAAVRERGGGRISLLLLLFLAAGALGGCGTLRMEVVEPAVPTVGPVAEAPFRTATPGPASVTATRPRPTLTATATATPTGPSFSDVYFCLEPCAPDGSNARTTFPAGIDTIYTRWRYAGVPAGTAYERIWRNRGEEWVAYVCTWPGPRQGVETITLTEPDGLRAGPWELSVRVAGQVVLSETFTLTGEHEYWQPAGTFDSCYGKLSALSTATATPSATATRPRPTRPLLPTATPNPTATPSPTPTPTATPVPATIARFEVAGVETLAAGRRITFAWAATGREATIRGETAVNQNPAWTVPLSGTLAVEVAESVYRNPDFTLEVTAGDPLSPTVATRTVEVEWAACQHAYFFQPAPDLCPAGSPVQTRIAYQPFERGHMVWRENEDDIFVFYQDGSWERYANLWPEEAPEEGEEPPEGFYRPVRGFGLVWSHPEWGVRQRLGWGLAPEGESSLTYQAQIPLSERLLPTYWQRTGANLLYLTARGMAGSWEAIVDRLPGAREIAPH